MLRTIKLSFVSTVTLLCLSSLATADNLFYSENITIPDPLTLFEFSGKNVFSINTAQIQQVAPALAGPLGEIFAAPVTGLSADILDPAPNPITGFFAGGVVYNQSNLFSGEPRSGLVYFGGTTAPDLSVADPVFDLSAYNSPTNSFFNLQLTGGAANLYSSPIPNDLSPSSILSVGLTNLGSPCTVSGNTCVVGGSPTPTPTPVPEPSSCALSGISLAAALGFWLMGHRRQNAKG